MLATYLHLNKNWQINPVVHTRKHHLGHGALEY